jgi:ubiquinone biosynthesis monooxygenase Coq7
MSQHNVPDYTDLPLTAEDIRDLRSDHAGEHGAVAIYRGMLAVSRDPALRRFSQEHIAKEQEHLAFFDIWLPDSGKSRLLPLWYAAGWCLGASSALFGGAAGYTTVEAVETFVEHHYNEQIQRMQHRPALAPLVSILREFCADEVHHKNDAAARGSAAPSLMGRAWSMVVGSTSAIGVFVARRV